MFAARVWSGSTTKLTHLNFCHSQVRATLTTLTTFSTSTRHSTTTSKTQHTLNTVQAPYHKRFYSDKMPAQETKWAAKEVRNTFLKFFKEKGHTVGMCFANFLELLSRHVYGHIF